jgi:hypothetical protein
MKLEGKILATDSLGQDHIDNMYTLMGRTYDNVDRDIFEADLQRKDHVIVLHQENQMQGFSTLAVYPLRVQEKEVNVLFSGDTVIESSCWGSLELPRMWGAYAFSLMEHSERDAYWFLMSKGYKTYRFLPVFFNAFIPTPDEYTSEEEVQVRDIFAKNQFGESYDAQKGIISFKGAKDKLKTGVAEISDKRLEDPYISFFAQANPLWSKGDELACVAKLKEDNFNPMGTKLAKKGLAKAKFQFSGNILNRS